MEKVVFVEILDRRGTIKERVRIASFPTTIGRGYTNAVILEDRLINEEHLWLSLDQTGSLLIEDLNTINGTVLSKTGERVHRYLIPMGGEGIFRIGQTVLRIRGDDFPVEPTVLSKETTGFFVPSLNHGLIAFLIFMASFGIILFMYAQEITQKSIWSNLINMSLLSLIILAIWAGFWSFLNRLISPPFHFMTHLAIAGLASIAFMLFFSASEYYEFIYTSRPEFGLIQLVGFAIIFSLLLYAHLFIIDGLSVLKRILTSSLISAVIVGIALLIHLVNRKEFSNEIQFSAVIKPIGLQWVRSVSPDKYFNDLQKLKVRIDTMAQEDSAQTIQKDNNKK